MNAVKSISPSEPLEAPPIPFLCAPSDPKWKDFISAAINALDLTPPLSDGLTVSLALSVLCYVDETFYIALKPHCEFITADVLVTQYYTNTTNTQVNNKPIEKVWEWHSIIAILGAFGKGGLPKACKAFEKRFIAFNRTVSQPSNNVLQVNKSFYYWLKAELDARKELRITLMKHYFSWNKTSSEFLAVDAQVKLFLSFVGLEVYKNCLNWAMSATSGCLVIPNVATQCSKAIELYNSNKSDMLFPYSYCLGKDISEYEGDKFQDICFVLTVLYPDSVGKARCVIAQSKKSHLSREQVVLATTYRPIRSELTGDVSMPLGKRGSRNSHNSINATMWGPTKRHHKSVPMSTWADRSGTGGRDRTHSVVDRPEGGWPWNGVRDRSPMARDAGDGEREKKGLPKNSMFDFLKSL